MRRFASALLLLAAFAAQAFDEKAALRESQAAIGRQVGDYAFRDSEGKAVRLSELRGKPLIVNMVYTGCIQVCPATTQFLKGAVKDAERAVGPGTFRIATIGFNLPFDSPAAMKAFARKNGLDTANWLFLTPEADSLPGLVADLGFRYEATVAGFDHLLQVSILDRDGRVYRQVYGDDFPIQVFVEPLKELVFGVTTRSFTPAGLADRLRFLCTVYDPATGRYRTDYAIYFGIFAGGLSLMIMAVIIARMWLGNRRLERAAAKRMS